MSLRLGLIDDRRVRPGGSAAFVGYGLARAGHEHLYVAAGNAEDVIVAYQARELIS